MAQSREERNRKQNERRRLVQQTQRSPYIAKRRALNRAQGKCGCGRPRARKGKRIYQLCERCQRMWRLHGRRKRRRGICVRCNKPMGTGTPLAQATQSLCVPCWTHRTTEQKTRTRKRRRLRSAADVPTSQVFSKFSTRLHQRAERIRLRYELTMSELIREAVEEYLDRVESQETDEDRMIGED